MMLKRDNRGYSIMGLLSALLVVTILVGVAGVIVYFFYTSSRTTSLEGDLKEVRAAVSSFVTESSEAGTPKWPTENGRVPSAGGYVPIDFSAGFTDNTGKTVLFHSFLNRMPQHWTLGVWRIDSRGDVSVDLESWKY
jgi:hypothetical protein